MLKYTFDLAKRKYFHMTSIASCARLLLALLAIVQLVSGATNSTPSTAVAESVDLVQGSSTSASCDDDEGQLSEAMEALDNEFRSRRERLMKALGPIASYDKGNSWVRTGSAGSALKTISFEAMMDTCDIFKYGFDVLNLPIRFLPLILRVFVFTPFTVEPEKITPVQGYRYLAMLFWLAIELSRHEACLEGETGPTSANASSKLIAVRCSIDKLTLAMASFVDLVKIQSHVFDQSILTFAEALNIDSQGPMIYDIAFQMTLLKVVRNAQARKKDKSQFDAFALDFLEMHCLFEQSSVPHKGLLRQWIQARGYYRAAAICRLAGHGTWDLSPFRPVHIPHPVCSNYLDYFCSDLHYDSSSPEAFQRDPDAYDS